MENPAKQSQPSSRAPKWRWRRIILLLAGIPLAVLLVVTLSLDRFGQVERARPAPVIVVLGARVLPDGSPGDSLRARMRKATALHRQGLAKKLILTGGQGDYGRPESVVATGMAIAQGIPPGDILRETRSHSTRENVRFAAEICRAHGWTQVIVVSDPYHLWRARYLFRREGITAYTSPARECERNTKLPLRIQWTLREALAVMNELAKDAF
ncbi:MAG: YdcF family protein [Armatimonadota bacterium]